MVVSVTIVGEEGRVPKAKMVEQPSMIKQRTNNELDLRGFVLGFELHGRRGRDQVDDDDGSMDGWFRFLVRLAGWLEEEKKIKYGIKYN